MLVDFQATSCPHQVPLVSIQLTFEAETLAMGLLWAFAQTSLLLSTLTSVRVVVSSFFEDFDRFISAFNQ